MADRHEQLTVLLSYLGSTLRPFTNQDNATTKDVCNTYEMRQLCQRTWQCLKHTTYLHMFHHSHKKLRDYGFI